MRRKILAALVAAFTLFAPLTMAGVTDGVSMHADFWNTWDQAALEDFVHRCIHTAEEANCKP